MEVLHVKLQDMMIEFQDMTVPVAESELRIRLPLTPLVVSVYCSLFLPDSFLGKQTCS